MLEVYYVFIFFLDRISHILLFWTLANAILKDKIYPKGL